jgi:hypothetical protein
MDQASASDGGDSVGWPVQDNDELYEFWVHALNLRGKSYYSFQNIQLTS